MMTSCYFVFTNMDKYKGVNIIRDLRDLHYDASRLNDGKFMCFFNRMIDCHTTVDYDNDTQDSTREKITNLLYYEGNFCNTSDFQVANLATTGNILDIQCGIKLNSVRDEFSALLNIIIKSNTDRNNNRSSHLLILNQFREDCLSTQKECDITIENKLKFQDSIEIESQRYSEHSRLLIELRERLSSELAVLMSVKAVAADARNTNIFYYNSTKKLISSYGTSFDILLSEEHTVQNCGIVVKVFRKDNYRYIKDQTDRGIDVNENVIFNSINPNSTVGVTVSFDANVMHVETKMGFEHVVQVIEKTKLISSANYKCIVQHAEKSSNETTIAIEAKVGQQAKTLIDLNIYKENFSKLSKELPNIRDKLSNLTTNFEDQKLKCLNLDSANTLRDFKEKFDTVNSKLTKMEDVAKILRSNRFECAMSDQISKCKEKVDQVIAEIRREFSLNKDFLSNVKEIVLK